MFDLLFWSFMCKHCWSTKVKTQSRGNKELIVLASELWERISLCSHPLSMCVSVCICRCACLCTSKRMILNRAVLLLFTIKVRTHWHTLNARASWIQLQREVKDPYSEPMWILNQHEVMSGVGGHIQPGQTCNSWFLCWLIQYISSLYRLPLLVTFSFTWTFFLKHESTWC